MSAKEYANKKASQHDHIEPRTARAALCALATDAYTHGEGSGMFDVHSASDNVYTVDLREERCTCPDHIQREPDGGCYHIRRVKMVFGLEDVPEELEDDVDGTLAANREKFTPDTESEDVEAEATARSPVASVATDGGVVLEEAESEDRGGHPADRDVRLETNRIATEAVANADGPLADFDVFCLTVEATQDTLLRVLKK